MITTMSSMSSRMRMAARSVRLRGFATAVLLVVSSTAIALAQAPKGQTPKYEPQVGQEGKDVVWVPTADSLVDRMLDMAKVTPQDYLIDLGSGDGRTVIAAAQRGLKAHGIEYNPDMVELSKVRAAEAGVSDRVTFAKADIFESDFSKASVITLFLLPSLNERLRPTILDLKPGTRIVSNTFGMGDWNPDEQSSVAAGCTNYCTALLWIVPAKVDGAWRLDNQDLKLTQQYQALSGTLGSARLSDARLSGASIRFTVDGVRYAGTVAGNTMSGTRSASQSSSWTATRK